MSWSRLSEQNLRADKWSVPGLGCHADWQQVEVGLIRGAAVKARVGTPVSADRGAGIGHGVVGAQIDPQI